MFFWFIFDVKGKKNTSQIPKKTTTDKDPKRRFSNH